MTGEWKLLNHFEASEFDFPDQMDFGFLQRLDLARSFSGIQYEITSDVRTDDIHSPHITGKAVDIRAHHSWVKFKIVRGLLKAGFTRIGVYDKHVHVDSDPQGPTEVLWIGESI